MHLVPWQGENIFCLPDPVKFGGNILYHGPPGGHIHGLHAEADPIDHIVGMLLQKWYPTCILITSQEMKKIG